MTKKLAAPRLMAGASGYSYKEWKGDFYPAHMKPTEMLAYYAARLATVELNATFYRLPQDSVVDTGPRPFRRASASR